jgi:hypothetical protein
MATQKQIDKWANAPKPVTNSLGQICTPHFAAKRQAEIAEAEAAQKLAQAAPVPAPNPQAEIAEAEAAQKLAQAAPVPAPEPAK